MFKNVMDTWCKGYYYFYVNKKIGENNNRNISVVIRHDLGENFSFYYGRRS
jgi:hypothetical protein